MGSHDLTLAVRNLFHRPGFAAAAILLLALGAGANAAVFSVVRGVLLQPLPYPEPDRLVAVGPDQFFSNQDLFFWRNRVRAFESVAASSPGWMMALVAEGTEPLKVTGAKVSGNFFETLGVGSYLGRALQPGDEVPGQHRVAVIAYALWQTHFGGAAGTLGRTVLLDQEPFVIVGILPPGFEFLGPGTDLFAPLPDDPASPQHRAGFSQVFARLAPGATPDMATREIAAAVPDQRRELGYADDWGQAIAAVNLREAVVGDLRPTLLILLGAVGLVLLLAATNLGTLVLGRTIERTKEIALRTALGASKARLLRQLLVEQAVLAAAGAVAGLALAWLTLPLLMARVPPELPRLGEVSLDLTVFAVVFTASVAVAILVTLVPAALAIRPSIQPLLRQTRSTETPARRRALDALVAAQIGLAVVLSVGAALMLKSLWNLQQVDPGFDVDRVLAFRLQTTSKYRGLGVGLPYFEQVVERVRALPGVSAVGAINHLPLSGYSWTNQVEIEGQPTPPGQSKPSVGWRFIGWDYFQAMGIAIRHGRAFDRGDHTEGLKVAIVNEAFARRFFPVTPDAIGRSMRVGGEGREEDVVIVGVAADVHHHGLDTAPRPELYRPLAQTFMFPMKFVVRTEGDPAALSAPVRQATFAVDAGIPVAEIQPLSAMLVDSIARPRLLALLLSVFAGVGLLLGLVGLYGVVAYRVRQREREIGIRLALGARPSGMAGAVVRQGLWHAAAGLAVGLPAAWALGRLMQSVLFGVEPRDPATFAALPLVVLGVTALACYLPAQRAARIDPALTMREE